MIFRNVVADDLESLIQLENEGFTKEEAATTQALKQRIEIIPDTFIVAEENNQIVGLMVQLFRISVLQMIYLHRLDLTPIWVVI